jgi:general secretion pathway protein F
MARFKVRILDSEMALSELVMDSASEADVHQQMLARGLSVLSVSQAPMGLSRGSQKFPLQLFAQELLALLESGLPLVESIETLAERETRPWHFKLPAASAAASGRGSPFHSLGITNSAADNF